MALIEREVKETTVLMNVRIETTLAQRLKEYAAYLESRPAHVISEAIRYVIDRDKDYAALVAGAKQDRHGKGKANGHQKSVVA